MSRQTDITRRAAFARVRHSQSAASAELMVASGSSNRLPSWSYSSRSREMTS
jgi:hypothetical protein